MFRAGFRGYARGSTEFSPRDLRPELRGHKSFASRGKPALRKCSSLRRELRSLSDLCLAAAATATA
jgi:hypothetical protein